MTQTGRRPRYWERELVGAGAAATTDRDGGSDRPDDN